MEKAKKLKILIADDSAKMRRLIIEEVTHHVAGIDRVYECESGEQAVQLCKRYHPDWILLDIKMEPLDGLAAARMIKSNDPGARIILVTNYDEEGSREEARKITVEAYVLKENLHKLIEIIQPINS